MANGFHFPFNIENPHTYVDLTSLRLPESIKKRRKKLLKKYFFFMFDFIMKNIKYNLN